MENIIKKIISKNISKFWEVNMDNRKEILSELFDK